MSVDESYILYKTTNLTNGRFYVGVHKQKTGFLPHEFDGYLGSGKCLILAVRKYGKKNFIRETLEVFSNRIDAENAERLLVNTKFLSDLNVYNVNTGGGLPPYHPDLWIGKKHSLNAKLKISKNRRGKGAGVHHWTRDHDKQDSLQKMIAINSSKIIEFNKKFKPALGHKKTDEVKMHLSNKNKTLKWYKNLNTKECVFARECPEGFISGRLFQKNIGE